MDTWRMEGYERLLIPAEARRAPPKTLVPFFFPHEFFFLESFLLPAEPRQKPSFVSSSRLSSSSSSHLLFPTSCPRCLTRLPFLRRSSGCRSSAHSSVAPQLKARPTAEAEENQTSRDLCISHVIVEQLGPMLLQVTAAASVIGRGHLDVFFFLLLFNRTMEI
ncbi:uncharacterized protein LOC110028260 [Phalaenopsis equestris]|uniref:uncharacterized protein LOC110028260 n=1 Tax=Phalaenopsis equestris TaxID=78828 RepID=UPI0009E2490C|nr:uncharacterized protein LOC110028260 [Phalaenopsis equestris]